MGHPTKPKRQGTAKNYNRKLYMAIHLTNWLYQESPRPPQKRITPMAKVALANMVILESPTRRILARGKCKTSERIYAPMDIKPNGEHKK